MLPANEGCPHGLLRGVRVAWFTPRVESKKPRLLRDLLRCVRTFCPNKTILSNTLRVLEVFFVHTLYSCTYSARKLQSSLLPPPTGSTLGTQDHGDPPHSSLLCVTNTCVLRCYLLCCVLRRVAAATLDLRDCSAPQLFINCRMASRGDPPTRSIQVFK